MSDRETPRPFRPAPWLPGPHAQTIVGRYLRRALRVPLRRERVETPDGDFLDLDWVQPAYVRAAGGEEGSALVLLLHGLEGASESGYVQQSLRHLARRGVRGVAMNFRSCSGEMNRTRRFYHAGETGDLALVLDLLRERHPAAPLGAAGFSLGGNVLLKYLGERPAEARARLVAAAAVSVPFDLGAGADRLERGMGRVYTRHFMRKLLHKYRVKHSLVEGHCDPERVARTRTLRDFDDAATAPLHGFRDADDYYARSSSAGFLGRIRVPTLLLQAEDDPFLPPAALPRAAIAENPALVDGFVAHGGHVGFVEGPPWAPRFWAEEELARFLGERLRVAGAAARQVRSRSAAEHD